MNPEILADEDLSSKAKLVYLTLAVESKGMTTVSIGTANLAKLTSLGRDTVLRAVKELAEDGWIEIEQVMDVGGRPAPNRYVFL